MTEIQLKIDQSFVEIHEFDCRGMSEAEVIKRVCIELTERNGSFTVPQVADGVALYRKRRCPTTEQIRHFLNAQKYIVHEGRRYDMGIRLSFFTIREEMSISSER